MPYIVVSIAALIVSALALYSGFGLGTLLMPVFALFFDVEVAVAATAVVHLATNVFRVAVVGRAADLRIVALFGLPGVAFAFIGAYILTTLGGLPVIAGYSLGGRMFLITPVKLMVAAMIFVFAVFELTPRLSRLQFERRYLPLGGALSGFFGGLSGHQGALRSAFLAKSGLTPTRFVGTNALCGFVVDLSRVLVYGAAFYQQDIVKVLGQEGIGLIAVAIVAAFVGTTLSSRLLKRVTMRTIRLLVGVMLLALAIALSTGLV